MKRLLGIDCGSNATGYGVIDTDGRASAMIASGVIRPRSRSAFPERLRYISESLRELIHSFAPAEVAIEGVFHSVNARSALQLGHVRGVALLVAAESNLPVHEYSPLQIKSSVVGYGRAEKMQVQEMVKLLLRLDALPPEDAADALAVALCHAHHSLTLEKLSRSASRVPARPARSLATPA
ncbi:MAG: crossover junction endodeoxyribonuclease RuvC [Acidobacteria bacterium RIFCSPLOWO2_02_FULL_60_20]|nr:MAG: crossover junction endodeoxyribonuclease RuvC [Acidobacteria bacterium RIFCSPLOWO2_02_FULL_60_20]